MKVRISMALLLMSAAALTYYAYDRSNDDGLARFETESGMVSQIRLLDAGIDRELLQLRIGDNTASGVAEAAVERIARAVDTLPRSALTDSLAERLEEKHRLVAAYTQEVVALNRTAAGLRARLNQSPTSPAGGALGVALMTSQDRLDELLLRLSELDIGPAIDVLEAETLEAYGLRRLEASEWRQRLFLLALALIVSCAVLGLRVARKSVSLSRLNRELEDRVARRTASLQAALDDHASSEFTLRAILDAVDAEITLLDSEGYVVRSNQVLEAAELFDADDTGAPAKVLYEPASAVAPKVSAVLGGTSSGEVVEFDREDHERRQVYQARVTPLIADDGVKGCVILKTDVTAQSLAAEEARLLSLVARYTDNAVLIMDRSRRCRWVNAGFSRITGYTLDDVQDTSVGDLLSGPETDPDALKALVSGFSSSEGANVEMINYRKNGEPYWVSLETRPISGGDDAFSGFLCVASEITERKRISRELEEERQRLRAILAHIPFMVYWTGRDGHYLGCNPAYAEHVGLSDVTQIVGRSDGQLPANAGWIKRNRNADWAVMSNAMPTIMAAEEFVDDDGAFHSLSVSKVPLLDADNDVVGIIGVIADVTAQREIETRLAESGKLESIGQLAAGIAHEINTPTQYVGDNTRFLQESFGEISGVLDKARALATAARESEDLGALAADYFDAVDEVDLDYLNEEVPAAVEQTLNGVAQVRKIVASMKAFSHPGEDQMSPADLNSALRSTLVVATSEWKYVATTETRLDEDLPMVPCYLGELNQVFLNIVVNAAHAIGDANDGKDELGTIEVTTRQVGDMAEVRIKDSGTGMPEHV
ncbi:MAG: PAS domain-containing protein, partial [Pseudomonadota bacterium]